VLLFPRVAGHTSSPAARGRGRGGGGGGRRGEGEGGGGSISAFEGPGETFIEISRDEGMSSGDHDSWRDSLHKTTNPRWRTTGSSSRGFPERAGGRIAGKSMVMSGREGGGDKDDALLSSVRTTVANIWFRIRHEFPHFDEVTYSLRRLWTQITIILRRILESCGNWRQEYASIPCDVLAMTEPDPKPQTLNPKP
jgi:hypothetical protein